MRDRVDEQFRKLDHGFRRAVHAVPEPRLPLRGGLDFGMVMAEQVRPPAAHEIEIGAAIDIPQAAALRPLEELRIAFGQAIGVKMPPHAAWNDAQRSVAKGRISGVLDIGHGYPP